LHRPGDDQPSNAQAKAELDAADPLTMHEAAPQAPRCEFGSGVLTDSDEFNAFARSKQRDARRRVDTLRLRPLGFALIDRLDAAVEGAQVPSVTAPTDHPQPTTGGIKGDPATDWEFRELGVRCEP
jgi:hypothetical protein